MNWSDPYGLFVAPTHGTISMGRCVINYVIDGEGFTHYGDMICADAFAGGSVSNETAPEGYYVQPIVDCKYQKSGFRNVQYQLMKDGQKSSEYFLQEHVAESHDPWSGTHPWYSGIFDRQPTHSGGQSEQMGRYNDSLSPVGSWTSPRTLVQTFFISKTPTSSSLLAPGSMAVPIKATLANGQTVTLPSQTIVKNQTGAILIRGTNTTTICTSGSEYQ